MSNHIEGSVLNMLSRAIDRILKTITKTITTFLEHYQEI